MYCGHCGSLLREGAALCGTCGAPVPRDEALAAVAVRTGQQYEPTGGPFDGGRVGWTLRDVLFALLWFLGLLLVVPLVIAIPFAVAAGVEATVTYGASLVGSAIADAGFVVVAAWFSFRKYGGGWERLGFRAPGWSTAGWALAALVAALALGAAYGLIIEAFDIDALKSECDDQIPEAVLDSAALMTITGFIVIGMAPICEETLFRGFVFPGMAKAWGIVAAIAASGFVFAAAHVGPAWHKTLVPIFIIGAVFAAAYYRSGNILSTIAAHGVFNTISFVGLTQCDTDDAASLAWARELLAGAMGR
jgi:hypothetical protein